MKKLDELAVRVRQLIGATPPSFEEFFRKWGNMDELSRSLYEVTAACPGLTGATGPYWETVRGHMARMGITPEPFTLEDILEDMGNG